MITEKDIYEYREIYYEYFKPALNGRCGMTNEEAEKIIKPALEKFGWTHDKYQAFSHIDLMQRIAKMSIKSASEDRIQVRTHAGEKLEHNATLDMPELKCPRRTEQID